MRPSLRGCWGFLCATLVWLACSTPGPNDPHPGVERLWVEYKALPAERALAIAGDPNRQRWVAGVTGGHELRSEAEESALVECRRRRAARRMRAPCRLYASGNEIVWSRR